MTKTAVATPDPDPELLALASWVHTNEPTSWAAQNHQAIVIIARQVRDGFANDAALQGVLDSTYPDAGYKAKDLLALAKQMVPEA